MFKLYLRYFNEIRYTQDLDLRLKAIENGLDQSTFLTIPLVTLYFEKFLYEDIL